MNHLECGNLNWGFARFRGQYHVDAEQGIGRRVLLSGTDALFRLSVRERGLRRFVLCRAEDHDDVRN